MQKARETLKKIINFIQDILDMIDMRKCPFCLSPIPHYQAMCHECKNRIHFINGTFCYRCGRPLAPELFCTDEKFLCYDCIKKRPAYELARSAYVYNQYSRLPILVFKKYCYRHLVPFFIHFLLFAGRDLFPKIDIIIPVPMHWAQRVFIKRGSPTKKLAYALSYEIKKPCKPYLLRKTRFINVKQEGKSGKDRVKNARGLYEARFPSLLKGKSILLLDDVLTTGSTANACARALKKAGAKSVYVLTIASTQHKNSPTYVNYED